MLLTVRKTTKGRSSKGMEKQAAPRLWGRSLRKNNMRYTKMLSNGDSVAYTAVIDANY